MKFFGGSGPRRPQVNYPEMRKEVPSRLVFPEFNEDPDMEKVVRAIGYQFGYIRAVRDMDHDPKKEGDVTFLQTQRDGLRSLIEKDEERLLSYLQPYIEYLATNQPPRLGARRGKEISEAYRFQASFALKNYLEEKDKEGTNV